MTPQPEPDPNQPHHPTPTSEINNYNNDQDASSPDSEDLHETRPNRWRGHPSTWRTWTENDRQTWTALENVRKEALGVHLYNAYGLRRGYRRGPEVEDEVGSLFFALGLGLVRFVFWWWGGGGLKGG